jgi:hypothetical protein
MKQKFLVLMLLAIFGLVWTTFQPLNAQENEKKTNIISTMNDLSTYMGRFGVTVAGLEIMRNKDENIDWQLIRSEVRELNKVLAAMKKSDQTKKYNSFLDELALRLREVTQKAKKKDPSFYDSFDKMTDSCFACHTAHRPADFLKPNKSNYSNK